MKLKAPNGFGSVAKYVAVSMMEAGLDVASMARTSTKIFVMEVMGRHAGWLAAAAGLAGNGDDEAPHIILLPERAYDEAAFLAKVKQVVERVGHCVVVASEGIATADGTFVADRILAKHDERYMPPQMGDMPKNMKAPKA